MQKLNSSEEAQLNPSLRVDSQKDFEIEPLSSVNDKLIKLTPIKMNSRLNLTPPLRNRVSKAATPTTNVCDNSVKNSSKQRSSSTNTQLRTNKQRADSKTKRRIGMEIINYDLQQWAAEKQETLNKLYGNPNKSAIEKAYGLKVQREYNFRCPDLIASNSKGLTPKRRGLLSKSPEPCNFADSPYCGNNSFNLPALKQSAISSDRYKQIGEFENRFDVKSTITYETPTPPSGNKNVFARKKYVQAPLQQTPELRQRSDNIRLDDRKNDPHKKEADFPKISKKKLNEAQDLLATQESEFITHELLDDSIGCLTVNSQKNSSPIRGLGNVVTAQDILKTEHRLDKNRILGKIFQPVLHANQNTTGLATQNKNVSFRANKLPNSREIL